MTDGATVRPPAGAQLGPNVTGALMMVLAMLGFAVEDALFKGLVRTLPPGQVTVLFGLLGASLFAVLSWRAGEAVIPPEAWRPRLLVRTAFEIVGRLFFALSLVFVPLATTSAILQAAPLFVTLGAALVLGERVGPRRWAAVLAGFAGVLLILRPAPGSFQPEALLAVAGMIGFAGRDLATRTSPPRVTQRQLGTLGFLVILLAGVILMVAGAEVPQRPAPGEAGRILALAAVGVLAYTALNRAMRIGEVAVVAPFRYVRLLFALVLAMVLFGERPDALTLAGGALIVASGLYTLLRSRRAGRGG